MKNYRRKEGTGYDNYQKKILEDLCGNGRSH
jgi:hypothetical protein